ncbi:MAG: extracellular solute-binding protein [Oscillospiraceae bacterium]|nr:extracellular solute-binding protein [Oscillospiraceae bacterium]
MRNKKLLGAFFAVLAILASVFSACSPAPENDGADAPAKDDLADAGEADPNADGGDPEAEQKYEFPGQNYGGYKMRVLIPDHDDWAMSTIKAMASDTGQEEENGDPLNDANYKRNRLVEDGLGVEIEEILVSGPEAKAKKAIQANTDDYDVVFTDSSQAGIIASQGMYLDLYELPGLNLDKPYWNQKANESVELLGKLYFTTSDANIITNDAIWLLYFNKKIQQDLGLGNPYALVREGKWTVDAFYSMARESARDLDGDGRWTVADQWGISTHGLGFLAFFECQEEKLVRLDEKGEPYLVNPNEKFVNAFINAHRLMEKENGVFLDAQGSYPGQTSDLNHAKKTFMADMSLFCAEVLAHARVFREMTADFGLLPHPKYDENQKNYYTFMIDTVPAFGIPITAAESERSAAFMDAFTAVSNEVLIPAYYKISLEGKFTRDEDSIEMLDIIRDGRVFDLAVLYNWGSFYSAVITYGTGKEGTNPMSIFEKNRGKVETAIQKTLDSFNSW